MIKINGIRWRLVKVSSSNPTLRMPNDSLALGCCDTTNHTIYVRKGLEDEKLKEVLIHEIAHAVVHSYNINLSEKEEEKLVSIISSYGLEIAKQVQKALK